MRKRLITSPGWSGGSVDHIDQMEGKGRVFDPHLAIHPSERDGRRSIDGVEREWWKCYVRISEAFDPWRAKMSAGVTCDFVQIFSCDF
jgi:hypothetical protein